MEILAIFTIGHSTRTLEEFIALLKAHGIERLADIRTVPRSRRNPQFGQDVLPASLAREGIRYEHIPSLGGLRKPRPDSVNTAWRNASFRGYADYMSTPEFQSGIAHLIEISRNAPVAIMCAEAVPWRCHRNLVADALTARGIPVEHIVSSGKAQPHKLTSFARIRRKGQVIYPDERTGLVLPLE